jgi:hypothetical protein
MLLLAIEKRHRPEGYPKLNHTVFKSTRQTPAQASKQTRPSLEGRGID